MHSEEETLCGFGSEPPHIPGVIGKMRKSCHPWQVFDKE